MNKIRYSFFCLIGLALLLFGGCSSSPKPKGIYKIARDPSWYPLDLMGREKTVFAFSDELIQAIATREKLNVELYTMTWESLLSSVELNRVDAAFSSIAPTPENRSKFDFSDTYLLIGPVVIVPVSSPVKSLKDLTGKQVGVLGDQEALTVLRQEDGIIIRQYTNPVNALEDVANGTIDAFVFEALPAYSYCKDLFQGRLKVVTNPLTPQGLKLITSAGENPYLIQAFNRGLTSLKEDGSYAALIKKWGLGE